ncbi:MAG TPA: hypothetical protein PLJ44_01175 [Victivallales bacterium]|nr:hypothetical protein [Victivallales bacterium]
MKRKIILFFSVAFIALQLMSQVEIPEPPPKIIKPNPNKEKQNSEEITNKETKQTDIEKREASKVIFKNKDFLSGMLVSADKEMIEWKSEYLISSAKFYLNAVEKIEFPSSNCENEKYSITLINGDVISGEIISLNEERLVFQTIYAGKLNIPKKYLSSIYNPKKEGIIYKGPKEGDTEWVKVQNVSSQCRIVDDVMLIPRNSAAAIEISNNDLFKVSFEAPLSAMINIGVFANAPAMYNAGGYMIGINNNYVYIQSMSKRGGGRNLGNAQIEDLPDKAYIKYTILANRKNSSFTFMVEDRIIQKISDPNNKNNENGKFLVISYNHGAFREIKVKNILISEWDGLEDDNVEVNEKISSDMVFFTNKDKASGKLVEIKNNEVSFKTDFALLKIPEDRIAKIKFATSDNHTEIKSIGKPLVISKFLDKDQITLSLISIEDGFITAENPIFGKAKFSLNYCSSLIFNEMPDNPKQKQIDDSEENENTVPIMPIPVEEIK